MDIQTQTNIDTWLKGAYEDSSKQEILRLQRENPEALIDAFYTRLAFGTGGLRGIMGVGSNRMNRENVRMASQGFANYLKQAPHDYPQLSVLVGFDCRLQSREFAIETARVLAGNGIEVFLYKELRPVALISFGVQFKKCQAGVMITASHNPPEYNGYKVYWSHGGQVLPPHDRGIIEEVNNIQDPSAVKLVPFSSPLIHEVSEEIDEAYLRVISELQLHPAEDHSHGNDLHIVYSSLHGGGITIIPKALNEWGFTNLTIIKEQAEPDGRFPTIKSPNPEYPETLSIGIATLQKIKADLFFATDPDVDRIAVVAMDQGKPFIFTGNQMACLAAEYLCQTLIEVHQFPPKATFVKTIVTAELFRKIVEHYQATCLDVLTGFKYIGQKIDQWEEEEEAHVTSHHFIFGGEESYGYLYGTHAKDKDAVVSACLFSEMALHLKRQGRTLVDFLFDIYHHYGVHCEKLASITLEGKEGANHITEMMTKLRSSPPKFIGKTPVTKIEDYETRKVYYIETGMKESLTLPQSDVIRIFLEDETIISIRPSGTEPKLKIYCHCYEKHGGYQRKEIEKALHKCTLHCEEAIQNVKKMLGG